MTDLIIRTTGDPDPPPVTGVVLERGEGPARPARPIIPAWIRNPHDLRSTGKYAVLHTAHTAAFHTVRAPLYWTQYAVRAPQGSARLIGSLWRWAVFTEGLEARKAAKSDPEKFHKLTEQRQAMVRARMFMVGLGVLASAAAAWWIVTETSKPVAVASAMLLLLLLGLLGKGKPVIEQAATSEKAPKPSQDLILNALASLGLPKLKRGEAKLSSPVVAAGDGWHARIVLPAGMLAAEVIAKRPELASGLQRPVDCVWLEGNAAIHPGILDLWVGNHRMIDSPAKPWPYATSGEVSLFEPFVFGWDPRGRPISVTLMFTSGLLGSFPRMGKTSIARLLCLAAALDRTSELHLYDLKGAGDLKMFAPVATKLHRGASDDTIKALLDDLEQLDKVDLERRMEVLDGLGTDVCPDSKVTAQLATDPRYGLHPIVIFLDECHKAFEHKQYGPLIAEYATDLVKRGPAAGIITLLATQRPDSTSIPTAVSANVVLRWCLKVRSWQENNMVLGDGAHQNGIQATSFATEDKGICYFAGEGREPVIVRTPKVDGALAAQIVARAVKLRAVPELAAEPEEVAGDTILDDLAAIWPAGQEKVWWVTLAELLATRRPGLYGGLKGAELARMVQEHRLPSIDIHRGKATRKGCARIALDLVLEQSGPPPVGEWPRQTFDSGAALRLVRNEDIR